MRGVAETKTFLDIHNDVQSKPIHILQFFGFHGCGKTQIVLQLGNRFPFLSNEDQEKDCIRWQIQCSDLEHDVRKELQKLAEELQRNGFNVSRDEVYSIQDRLDNDMTGTLVQTLFDCKAHVLLVIEDPKKSSRRILSDLCQELHQKALQEREFKFHLYLTCRTEDQVLTECDKHKIQSTAITGFNEDEAVAFLNEAVICKTTGNEAARAIFMRFSGLPLGLHAAKGYCKQS